MKTLDECFALKTKISALLTLGSDSLKEYRRDTGYARFTIDSKISTTSTATVLAALKDAHISEQWPEKIVNRNETVNKIFRNLLENKNYKYMNENHSAYAAYSGEVEHLFRRKMNTLPPLSIG